MDTDSFCKLEGSGIYSIYMIHLKRVNVLETAISSKIVIKLDFAATGKILEISSNQSKDSQISVVFLLKSFRLYLSRLSFGRMMPPSFFTLPQIDITYEELCLDPDRQLDQYLHFWIESSPQWRTTFHKQRTQSIQSSPCNYNEQRKHYTGHDTSLNKFSITIF